MLHRSLLYVVVVANLFLITDVLAQQSSIPAESLSLRIPRVARPPKIEDFLSGIPREAEASITDFWQYEPHDGAPMTQKTTAYLSYDDKNLYVVFICRDEPGKIRAHRAKREDIDSDDSVNLNLDTFHDHRRAYHFEINPSGVQKDSIFTEGQGHDYSFDTLWYSKGQQTADGYIVWTAIPFKSLRFPRASVQEWGISLGRTIARNKEFAYWPYVTQRIESFLAQLATLNGLENISPGRNLQFIPFGAFSHARLHDASDLAQLRYRNYTDTRIGLDAKIILRDALTLDAALNPDFSQVESDEPQVTVNQRFEIFFPEKRPFFIENAGFFQTPINLFFSRRIADPQFGARLTGKLNRWGLGFLVIDDRARGELIQPPDSRHDKRSANALFRSYLEFGEQSNVGVLFTRSDFAGNSNSIISLDTRLKLSPNWVFSGQLAFSDAREPDSTHRQGASSWAELSYTGRNLVYASRFLNHSPDFYAELGFIPRVNIRKMEQYFRYYWKPEHSPILLFGPEISAIVTWNYEGKIQDRVLDISFGADLPGPTGMGCRHVNANELFQNLYFRRYSTDCGLFTAWLGWLELTADYGWGRSINYFPAHELPPFLASTRLAKFGFTLRPNPRISFDTIYFYNRLRTNSDSSYPGIPADRHIFTDHLMRSKLNILITRELSVRVILDYHLIMLDTSLMNEKPSRRITGDILITYFVNPGTAFYIGYVDRFENLTIDPIATTLVQNPLNSDTILASRQFFVKISYLLRF